MGDVDRTGTSPSFAGGRVDSRPQTMLRRTPPLPLALALATFQLHCGLVDPDESLRLVTVPDAPLPQGTLFQLVARPGDEVRWSSSDTAVVTATAQGIVWAHAPGSATISAVRHGDSVGVAVEVMAGGEGKIAFIGNRGIHVVRPDGGAETVPVGYPLFPNDNGAFWDVDLCEDGALLVFSWIGLDSSGVYSVRLDGTALRKHAGDDAVELECVRSTLTAIYRSERLYELSLSTGATRPLWEAEPPGPNGGFLSRISAFAVTSDGSRIYFAGVTEGFPFLPGLGPAQEAESLYVASTSDIRGTRESIAGELAQDTGSSVPGAPRPPHVFFERLSVSPSGAAVLVTRSVIPSSGVHLVHVDSLGAVERVESLNLSPMDNWLSAFGPDGGSFVGIRTRFVDAHEGLAIVRLPTLEVVPVLDGFGTFHNPVWAR